jgi:GAF domain-containing protein
VAEESDLKQELETARATIAAQAIQIHRLEQQAERDSGAGALREILELSDIAGVTIGEAPYHALLEGIIQAAKRLFDASAASIALLDHETNELVFEAATEGDVVGMRFPAHQGIAGWVAMTGEPLAVSDVRRDPRWAKDFAASTGYIPKSILAVPLFVQEEVEGVLEVLDKANAASFGLDDMDLLSLFARPAAVAVEQARMVTGIGALLVQELVRLADEQGQDDLVQAAQAALAAGGTTKDQTLELARLVHSLSRRGERARQLAIEVLTSVARYS